VNDTIRIEYDRGRQLVNLMMGNYCIDQMTIRQYEGIFGLMAAVDLARDR
jgi:hypothetical protein